MKTIRVGLIGLGTVGSGVVHILDKHRDDFRRRAGVDLEIVRVCDRSADRGVELGFDATCSHSDWRDVVADESIDIIIELIGGTGVARDVVLESLRAGKQVVTANKALMATHGQEVFDTAAEHGVEVGFEASVGGGIPIIAPLRRALVSNEISAVLGIVNGTTNYMLTRMAEDSLDYDVALAEAQEKGFAEADPTADVDGLDAAAKIAILSSIAFNSRVTLSDVHAEGIRPLTATDFDYAREMGYVIKLLAIGRRTDAGIDVRVHPTLIRSDHPLASVNGVYNAIYVIGDAVGETMFFGEGAGSLPAASAVVGDLIEIARRVDAGDLPLVGCTCVEQLPIRDISELEAQYYIRMRVADLPGVLASAAAVFGTHGVSLDSVVQKASGGERADIVYVTHRANEAAINAALAEIEGLDVVDRIAAVIRVEEL